MAEGSVSHAFLPRRHPAARCHPLDVVQRLSQEKYLFVARVDLAIERRAAVGPTGLDERGV